MQKNGRGDEINMTIEKNLAQLFRMNEKARRRHTNPWSVFTRITTIPLLGLSFWSRVWLDWWSLVPIIIVILWLWLNPRIFPEPKSTDNWASKVVLGEWVRMNRKKVPIPKHHRLLPNIITVIGIFGLILFVYGLVVLHLWFTILGGILMMISKLWYADRMVWLYEDMKDATSEYKSWLY